MNFELAIFTFLISFVTVFVMSIPLEGYFKSLKRKKVDIGCLIISEFASVPTNSYTGDSGFDLSSVEDVVLKPGETKLIRTGLKFDIPNNYEIQIRPRSGLSWHTPLEVVFGTVDSGYKGEVGIIVKNNARQDMVYDDYKAMRIEPNGTIYIKRGDRIAQAIVSEIPVVMFYKKTNIGDSDRGSGGFGSSGI